jgi:hypothetical protein
MARKESDMNHHDAEITDVVIVLEGQSAAHIDESIAKFKSLGLEVVDVNPEEGVIEGNIDTARVGELKKVPGVSYVRSVFTYVADYPTNDPRDQDGAEEGAPDGE